MYTNKQTVLAYQPESSTDSLEFIAHLNILGVNFVSIHSR